MESVVALHAWQILMTIHELFTLWKLFSLLVTWECIFEAQKRLIELPFMHAIQHCKLMHACICITSIMPFTERGSMVRLLADSHVPKVGFEFHTYSPCNCKSTSHRR